MEQADEVPRGTLGTVRNATLLLRLLSQGPAFQQLTVPGLETTTPDDLLASVEDEEPQAEASPELKREYADNSYRIWLVSLGAAAPFGIDIAATKGIRDASPARPDSVNGIWIANGR